MYIVFALALILLLLWGPQWWTRRQFTRHQRHREDYPGTGGELARHLLDRFGLQQVAVETAAEQGDHYDPGAKAVRLTETVYSGKSLTAVAVAAHEVGHALQDQAGYAPLRWRTRLVRAAGGLEKLGSGLLLALPVLALVTRSPAVGILMFLAGLASLGTGTLVHLITLPVEWDASFRRALPILRSGYIPPEDQAGARRILTAAALTYVAGSLASLLNLWRWWAILRR